MVALAAALIAFAPVIHTSISVRQSLKSAADR